MVRHALHFLYATKNPPYHRGTEESFCDYFDTPSRIFLFLIDAFGSSDGSRRTYESAEMAANAFGSDKPWAAGFVIEYYGLMTTVIARHLTASASNAQFRVKLGIDDGLAVQVIGVQEFWNLFAYKLAEFRDAALNHVSLESENEVVDNAIAILHDGRTNLHIITPQLYEF